MSVFERYGLRLKRRRLLWKAFRKRRQLGVVSDKTGQISDTAILAFTCLRNERTRLPYFLEYYRELGVDHFLVVDNGSDDGSAEYLADQPDVSLWHTDESYRRARYGVSWLNWLQIKYGHGHWTLTVDADEFLVYPFCDTRPLKALTDWMDASSLRVFPAMLLDMYPKGRVDAEAYREGQNPFEIAGWFDSGNYVIRRDPKFQNLWIQGGPRARVFFEDQPEKMPALNKLPLVKWDRSFAYVDSSHMLLPRGLNRVYETNGGERISGCLMHAKLLNSFPDKAQEELDRQQHYAGGAEYKKYAALAEEAPPDFWHKWSEKYINWRQLEILGLMSKGDWA